MDNSDKMASRKLQTKIWERRLSCTLTSDPQQPSREVTLPTHTSYPYLPVSECHKVLIALLCFLGARKMVLAKIVVAPSDIPRASDIYGSSL